VFGPEILGAGIDNYPVLPGSAGSQPQKEKSNRTTKDFLQHSAAPFYKLPGFSKKVSKKDQNSNAGREEFTTGLEKLYLSR
jgi:hypothetical protein